jgi:hypothetical protein
MVCIGLSGLPFADRTVIHEIPTRCATSVSAGLARLEKEPAAGREAEHDLAAGFTPIKTTFGQKDTDAGPDAVLTSGGIQCMHDITYMTALLISNCPEDINLDFRGHKNFRSFIADFFHVFHLMVLVCVLEKRRSLEVIIQPGESPS